MEKFASWLRQPYPLQEGSQGALTEATFGFIFATLFLFVFRPFGASTQEVSSGQWLWVSIQFGSITFAVSLILGTLVRQVPGIFVEEKWFIWKEILWYIIFISTIGVANLLFSTFKYDQKISLHSFLIWQWFTFLVGIFPTAFGVFMKQMTLMRRYSTEAAFLSDNIHHRAVVQPKTTERPATLALAGENQNEILHLEPEQLLYISTADNYVQVFFVENGTLKNRLLRGTLKKMEDALADHAQFFRCHRTHLVNLEKVRDVSGNAQGYRLQLESVEASIPVSRSLNEEIMSKLTVGNER